MIAPTLSRRTVYVLSASLALAAMAAPVAAQTINAVMHAPLRSLDPTIGAPYIVRDYGYMVYDTLVARDDANQVKPQMASWSVSADGKTYTFTLRPDLKWHDGTAVTAEDCVASIQRWAQYDKMGALMSELMTGIKAKDDRSFEMTFSMPTDIALRALSKASGVAPFMMKKSVIVEAGGKPVTSSIGSGPFRFVASEYKPGVQAVFEKNKDYVPRQEPASGLAGGKVVKVDRVKWISMPDAMTAVNALSSQEIDYIELLPHDLLPMVEGDSNLTATIYKKQSFQNLARLNFTLPPFDNEKIRSAALLAIGQRQVLEAQSSQQKLVRTCAAAFGCDSPYASSYGADRLVEPHPDQARALLKEAGYDNTPVVLLHATDVATTTPMGPVIAQQLRQAGFNVQMMALDWASITMRRGSRQPANAGGWNIFTTSNVLPEVGDPLGFAPAAGSGDKAWFGWPNVPAIEDVRGKMARTSDPKAIKSLAEELDHLIIDKAVYLPLGEISVVTAKRKALGGQVDAAVPVFWNMTKSGK
ncbi:MAG: ABC transporter substrate-binding protein [Pseudacidovorax sp.]|nr:ABC transporter substrate-binding protein [Pseudacidovorax sp.]